MRILIVVAVLMGLSFNPQVIIRNSNDPDNIHRASGPVCSGACDVLTSFRTTDTGYNGSGGTGTGWTVDTHQTNPSCPGGAGAGFSGKQQGVGDSGNSLDGAGRCDEVLSAADNSAGFGGRAFRHYRAAGSNSNGGGIKFEPASDITTRFNKHWAFRWSNGFTWAAPNAPEPHYSKDMNINNSGVGGLAFMICGFEGVGLGCNMNGGVSHSSGVTWVDLYGGAAADGTYHRLEVQVDFPTSQIYMWLDGAQIMHVTGVSFNSFTTFRSVNPLNQEFVATDGYMDIDDFVLERDLPIGQQVWQTGGAPAPVAASFIGGWWTPSALRFRDLFYGVNAWKGRR